MIIHNLLLDNLYYYNFSDLGAFLDFNIFAWKKADDRILFQFVEECPRAVFGPITFLIYILTIYRHKSSIFYCTPICR